MHTGLRSSAFEIKNVPWKYAYWLTKFSIWNLLEFNQWILLYFKFHYAYSLCDNFIYQTGL